MNKPLWDRVRSELEMAGRMAEGVIDEGRMRLDAFRARKRADKAATQLGWAYYRATAAQTPLDEPLLKKLTDEIGLHENEARRLEEQVAEIERQRTGRGPTSD